MADYKDFKLQYITDKSGEQTVVILPIDVFRELMEDLEDLGAIAERRDEHTISREELISDLKKNGLIPIG
jgi:hypothetical protein